LAEGNQEAAKVTSAKQLPVRISVLSRARAASRSEVRTSINDAAELNAAASAPTKPANSTGTLSASDRQNLRAFAADSSQLDTIVADTQQDIDNQMAADEAAQAAAVKRAAKKAREKLESQYSTSGNLTYPERVGQPTRSYNAPLPTAAQIADRVSPVGGSYELSARFGQRGWIWSTGWHTGIDFVVPTGTVIRASASGTIINSGWSGAYGNRIEVDCGNGYIVTYNHLSRIVRSSGVVTAGQEIGRSGATGNITGPHLHFEVLYNGSFVNPAVWLWGASR
jgi:murein DD-endopeptidase MepM/ murein hydrolase activator NlpD